MEISVPHARRAAAMEEPGACSHPAASTAATHYRHFELLSSGPVSTVRLVAHPHFRSEQVDEFLGECCSVAEQPGCKALVIDCSEIALMRSEMLSWLIQLQRRLAEKGSSLIISGLRPEVRDVFKWTKLDQFFDIREDVASVSSSVA